MRSFSVITNERKIPNHSQLMSIRITYCIKWNNSGRMSQENRHSYDFGRTKGLHAAKTTSGCLEPQYCISRIFITKNQV